MSGVIPAAGPAAWERRLLDAARDAMAQAYAPYSGFRVGAALLCDDGSADGVIVPGCNVENASYPACLCAERTALASAVAAGQRRLRAIAVATDAGHPTPPCGVCRQVLVEFAPALPVLSIARDGEVARWTLDALLPAPFVPESLGAG